MRRHPPAAGPDRSPHPLAALAALDGVARAVQEAREACEELRWHPGLRRRWAVARAEAGVRCAQAGALVDGLRVPLEVFRDVARGATGPPAGVEGRAVLGALRAQAEIERAMPAPGSPRSTLLPLRQLVARLHTAAVAGDDPAEPGRLRAGAPLDVRGLGPAPAAEEVAARLDVLASLLSAPLPPGVPGLVAASVAHGELLALRPFPRGNGPVARAIFRHLLTREGVDPVGVVVPEALWAQQPNLYLGTAARFATGTAEGVAAWVGHCALAVVAGARVGGEVADAVASGRLGPPPAGSPDGEDG